MKKAHILAEHPFDPEIRCEVFIDGNLMLEFDGDNYLCNVPAAMEGREEIQLFRGQPIRMGSWIMGKSSDSNRTLAEITRDMVVAQAEEIGVPVEVTEL